MFKLNIDGAKHTGCYRVDCECGNHWSGQGVAINSYSWSPALPIAEAVAHMKLEHAQGLIELRFSARFEVWLLDYWERETLRSQREWVTRKGALRL